MAAYFPVHLRPVRCESQLAFAIETRSIEARVASTPVVRAFVGQRYAQQCGFVKTAAYQLQPDRQAVPGKATGNRNRGMTGKICRTIHSHERGPHTDWLAVNLDVICTDERRGYRG